eukprot:TRINITY_DN781807_c0_g1_i1.p1 TRINITY_DN781807_c0_g1~~TRINITY_DN781807_c0_g1_i1.p1  ORF type:complete len:157 (+),score=27.69 TRINITY_DN781807_c0_g1_i1:149-619(+)
MEHSDEIAKIRNILKEMGISAKQVEPRVISQLLEFRLKTLQYMTKQGLQYNKYITTAGGKQPSQEHLKIKMEALRLALDAPYAHRTILVAHERPQALKYLHQTAQLINKKPLPQFPESYGFHLPGGEEQLTHPVPEYGPHFDLSADPVQKEQPMDF